MQDASWPNYVGPIGGLSYEYAGDNGANFTTNYGPNSGWPQAYLTAQPGGYGGQYNRLTFKKARPKNIQRRYRVTCWIYTAATNINFAQIWILGTNTDAWDGSAVGYGGDTTPVGCVNQVNPGKNLFVRLGVEFNCNIVGTSNWKPIVELNTSGGAPNGIWHVTGVTVEDITSEAASAASASASSSSAAVASGAAAAAQTSATLSAQFGTGGGNRAPNSDLVYGTEGWAWYSPYPGSYDSTDRNRPNDNWRPTNENVLTLHQNNQNAGEWAQWHNAERLSVTGGKWYEWSVYAAAHRAGVGLKFEWYRADGSFIRDAYRGLTNGDGNGAPVASGGRDINNWTRRWVIDKAPDDAAQCHIVMFKDSTYSGQGDSWAWFCRMQFREVPENFVGPSTYAPSANKATLQQISAVAADAYGRTRAFWQVNAAVPGQRAQLSVYADNAGAGVDIVGDVAIGGNLVVDGTINGWKLADLAVGTLKINGSAIDYTKLAQSAKANQRISAPFGPGAGPYFFGNPNEEIVLEEFLLTFSYQVWLMYNFAATWELVQGSFNSNKDAEMYLTIRRDDMPSTAFESGSAKLEWANSHHGGKTASSSVILNPGTYRFKLITKRVSTDGRFWNGWNRLGMTWGAT